MQYRRLAVVLCCLGSMTAVEGYTAAVNRVLTPAKASMPLS